MSSDDTNDDTDFLEVENFIDDNCYTISSLSVFYSEDFKLDSKDMTLSYTMSLCCSPVSSTENNIPTTIKLNIGDTFSEMTNIMYLCSILVHNTNQQNEEEGNIHGRVLHLFLNDLNGSIKQTLINLQSKESFEKDEFDLLIQSIFKESFLLNKKHLIILTSKEISIEEYQNKSSSDNNEVKEVYNAFLLGYILFLVNDHEGKKLITTSLNDLAISFWIPTKKEASIQQNDVSSISGSSSSSSATSSSSKSSSSTEQPSSATVTITSSTSSSNCRASLFRAAKAPPAITKAPDTPRSTKRGRKPSTPARDDIEDANVVDVETTTKEILQQAFEKSPLRKKKRNYKKKATAKSSSLKQNVVVNLINEKEEVKKSEPTSVTRSRGRPRNLSDISNESNILYDDTTSYEPQQSLSVQQLSTNELLIFEERLKVLEAMNKEEAELKRRATLQQTERLLTQQKELYSNREQMLEEKIRVLEQKSRAPPVISSQKKEEEDYLHVTHNAINRLQEQLNSLKHQQQQQQSSYTSPPTINVHNKYGQQPIPSDYHNSNDATHGYFHREQRSVEERLRGLEISLEAREQHQQQLRYYPTTATSNVPLYGRPSPRTFLQPRQPQQIYSVPTTPTSYIIRPPPAVPVYSSSVLTPVVTTQRILTSRAPNTIYGDPCIMDYEMMVMEEY